MAVYMFEQDFVMFTGLLSFLGTNNLVTSTAVGEDANEQQRGN